MKPAAQRDILVAHWLLFDEFEIGASDPVVPPAPAAEQAAAETRTKPLAAAKSSSGGKPG